MATWLRWTTWDGARRARSWRSNARRLGSLQRPARRRGVPRLAGHQAATENTRRIIESYVEYGVRVLTLYACSTENWQRPRDEVDGLLAILAQVIDRETAALHKNGVRLRHIGSPEGLPRALRERVEYAVELTQANDRLL